MREQSISEPEWAAVNDLLFANYSKPFFQRTLQEIRITHDFVLTDQAVGFCGGGIGCGLSTRRFPHGFPPIAVYQLQTTMTSPGDTLFQEQPVAIHYRRIVVPTNGEVELSNCGVPTEVRQTHLAQFLSAIDGLSIRQSEELIHPRSMIIWRDNAHAASEMKSLLDEQAASIQALVGHAQQRGLVDASGLRLNIETTVVDVRRDRSGLAPSNSPREIIIP